MKTIILTLLALFLIGCSNTEKLYVYPTIPDNLPKPEAQDYNVSMVEINQIEYYILTQEDARILSENWIKYKAYTEGTEELLNQIRNLSKKDQKDKNDNN